jgi:macrolide transport system ATP-binding/permease protein
VSEPLIRLEGIRKSYGGDDEPTLEVLRGVSFDIRAGEFVAIVGSSGSGKSTLMNILGCLDRPTHGDYRFAGEDVSELDAEELARLRREAFGFIFQQYHLIRTESALENVQIPAMYAGVPAATRHERAVMLLKRLGLGERLHHRPGQLSGGQQQRVSIARALMNGGRIILADEPTGALDSRSGQEVMQLLEDLARAGHTVIIITHDREVAARADRLIEMRDGEIIADRTSPNAPAPRDGAPKPPIESGSGEEDGASLWADVAEAGRSAWRAMWVHRFRTALTLLGIVIGVASVIVMLAVGEGSKRQVMEQMSAFGTNILYVWGQRGTPRAPGGVITREDVQAISRIQGVTHAMGTTETSVNVRRGNVDYGTNVQGVGVSMPQVQRWAVESGTFFTQEDERALATVVVLGKIVKDQLFPGGESPLGQYVLVGSMPFRVIGVMAEKGAASGDSDDDDVIFVPFATASARIVGQRNPRSVVVVAERAQDLVRVEAAVDALLLERHRLRDFRIRNRAAMIEAEAKAQDSMSLLLGMIAAISLLVGGIGVMNVMLMTVRERTREIGIRVATGARQRDIQRQFLSEALLVSTAGGVVGVALGLLVGSSLQIWEVPSVFSVPAVVGAFACAMATGLVFGFMPARRAAQLDPVVALASE